MNPTGAITLIPFSQEHIGSGSIYRAAMPKPDEAAKYKAELGITTVVQLCEDSDFGKFHKSETLKAYEELGFHLIKFPIPDGGAPKDAKSVRRLTKEIVGRAQQGEKILIHDVLGKGRTALVIACIARRVFGYDQRDSTSFAKRFIPGASFGSTQEQFIANLYKDKGQKSSSPLDAPLVSSSVPTNSVTRLPSRKLNIDGPIFIPLPEDKIGTGKIYRSHMPTPIEAAAYKTELNLSTVVQLCEFEEYAKYGKRETPEMYKALGLKVIPFPIVDFQTPKLEDLKDLILNIIEETKQGRNILVHCFAGNGRTGLVLACLAGTVCDLSAEDAEGFIRQLIPEALRHDNQKTFLGSFLSKEIQEEATDASLSVSAVVSSVEDPKATIPTSSFSTDSGFELTLSSTSENEGPSPNLASFLEGLLDIEIPNEDTSEKARLAAIARGLGKVVEESVSDSQESPVLKDLATFLGRLVEERVLKRFDEIGERKTLGKS